MYLCIHGAVAAAAAVAVCCYTDVAAPATVRHGVPDGKIVAVVH